MERRRDRYEVEADILRVAQGGAKKTWIVYKANLNFSIIKRYLAELIGDEKLTQSGKLYHTTEKGQEHIRLVEALRRI